MKPVLYLIAIISLMFSYIVFIMYPSDRAIIGNETIVAEKPIQKPLTPNYHSVPGVINSDYKYIYEKMNGITLWATTDKKGIVGYIDQPNATVEVLQKKDGFWLVRYKSVEGWASERILTANY